MDCDDEDLRARAKFYRDMSDPSPELRSEVFYKDLCALLKMHRVHLDSAKGRLLSTDEDFPIDFRLHCELREDE